MNYSDVYAEAEKITFRGVEYSLTQNLNTYYKLGDEIDLTCVWAISDVIPKAYYADSDKLITEYKLFPKQTETNIGFAFLYKPYNAYGNPCLEFGTGDLRTTIKTGNYNNTQIVRNLNTKNIFMNLVNNTIQVVNKNTDEKTNLTLQQFIELENVNDYVVNFYDEIANKINYFVITSDHTFEGVNARNVTPCLIGYGNGELGSPRFITSFTYSGVNFPLNWTVSNGNQYGTYNIDNCLINFSTNKYVHTCYEDIKNVDVSTFNTAKKFYQIGDNTYLYISSIGARAESRVFMSCKQAIEFLASLGIYAVYRQPNSYTDFENMVDSGEVALGEMLENGHTTGKWLKTKKEIYSAFNYDKPLENKELDPSPIDDKDNLAQQTMGLGKQEAKFLKYYSMSSADVDALSADINATTFSNPIQYIVSLTEFSPIIRKFIDTFSDLENIHLGGWTAPNASGFRVTESNGLFLVGSTQVDRVFNNFLDYSPYTMLNLYVPFCGTVQLPADTFVGKTLSVWMSFDIDSMNCLAMIFADGGYISNISGNLGKGYSISQTNYELYRLRALGGIFGVVTNLGAIAFNPVSALGLPATIGGMINSFNKSYSTLKQGNSDYTDFRTPCKCCLFRSVPKLDNLTGYKKSVGIKCEKFGKLKDFHGFTVCRNPHINISATEEEKEMLYELLSNGVILP